ncbi:MAG: transketolase [Actinobacteria bacterium]|nr:transketolase [Actinomycetota bacterium]
MDAVQRAESGHPGMPMGMADIATVLWTRHLVVDPADPTWPDRDRFVLSNGHGSMLLYALAHLSGFDLAMDDLRRFRQWGSVTAGHPEREPHLGIEMTTGPLGQGFGTAVGMAIAEAHLREVFGEGLQNHRTYVFCGDGDLMEGVSSEAASLAGHLGLGRLVVLYDDNGISIDGSTSLAFTEDPAARLRAMGWATLEVDGHDHAALDEAITDAVRDDGRPTLVSCRTHIGYGSPAKQDTAAAHGSPLGAEEIVRTKQALGWSGGDFEVPDEVYGLFRDRMAANAGRRAAWEQRRAEAFAADAALAGRWAAHWEPQPVEAPAPEVAVGEKMATRKASGLVINAVAAAMPALVGGSADLAPSNNTMIDGEAAFQSATPGGRNFHFGVREHAMGAAVNGMNLHGGLRAYGGTFLVFSDYLRPSLRLAALMGAPSIFVFTHDSFFLGEDGPTHQPIEHLASLRAMPNTWVIRPASASETAEAWEMALARTDGPTCLALTRQGVPEFEREPGSAHRGGYVVRDGGDAVLVATGSEVGLALAAAGLLDADGVSLRVVSMPCVEVFEGQDDAYRASVLPPGVPVASIEAGSTFGWAGIVGAGLSIGIDHFGASAPAGVLAEHFGFTPEHVAARIREWLAGGR